MKTTTLNEQIKNRKGMSFYPGDSIIIKTTPNMISSSISIIYKNPFFKSEDEHLSLPNNLKVWSFLKKISEDKNLFNKPVVDVKVQVWDENEENVTLVDYKDSKPYAYRFGNA